MSVIPDDVAVELGRPTPVAEPQLSQWQSWIERTVRQINYRATRLGVDPGTLDPQIVDDVVLLAVSTHARNPGGYESVDINVDDARESWRNPRSKGEISVTDEWWGWLFPDQQAGAFSTQTFGESDLLAHRRPSPVECWW